MAATKEKDAVEEKVLQELTSLFKVMEVENLKEAVTRWVASLPPPVFKGKDFSPEASILLEVMQVPGDLEKKLLKTLPDKFGLGEVKNWGEPEINRYKWRLARAKLEVEVFSLKDFFPIPEGQEERKNHFRKWVMKLMEDFDYTNEERESFIIDLMDKVVW